MVVDNKKRQKKNPKYQFFCGKHNKKGFFNFNYMKNKMSMLNKNTCLSQLEREFF